MATRTFAILLLFLAAGGTNAQKRTVGYSPPGPLGTIAPTPDTQPPTFSITRTTGVIIRGDGLQKVATAPQKSRVSISGTVEDNREVFRLQINGHNIPMVGETTKKSFRIGLRPPGEGKMREYEFVALDRTGNEFRQTYRIIRASIFEPPVLAVKQDQPPTPSGPVADQITPPSPTPPAPTTPQVLPKVWLFAIGISEFRDVSLNLSYAASDASSFYEFYRSDKGARLPKTQATLLVNGAATRAKVIQSLTRTVKIAAKNDLVIIFLATHGLPDADTGEINFLMHDTDVNNLVATGLSNSDLTRIIERSRAKKILFIVDACHSGELGSGPLLARRGITFSEVNRLLSMLAKTSDGVAMLTASSSNEASFEGEQWSGGVFTYYLLAGLQGRADSNKDQIVTLREAFDYLYETVPQATEGKQHPELKGQFSNELPLMEVNP